MTPEVEVLLEAEARDDEVAAVAAILADAGMEARVSTDPTARVPVASSPG